MQFHYVAYNLDKGVVKGWIEARDEEEAWSSVIGRGYKPLRVSPRWRLPSRDELFPSIYKVRTSDLIGFARELATMVASGASLQRTLEMLEEQTPNRVLRRILGEVRRIVDDGGTLSSALSKYPKVFDPLFVSVVQVGEFAGRLSPALEQLADMLDRSRETRQAIFKTLMMPMMNMLMAVTMLLIMIMITVIMPPLFANLEPDQIPVLMRTTMGMSQLVQDNPIQVIAGAIGAILFLRLLRGVYTVRLRLDMMKARAPIIGPILVSGELSRFSRTLALLLESGVSLVDALGLGIASSGNRAIRRAFREAQESLVAGHGMTGAFRRHSILPAMWVELVMIGEQSNALGRTMRELAEAYQKRAQDRVGMVVAVLDPVSTLVVGGVVAIVALSMIQPIMAQMSALAP